jgi:hypothetical protein
LGFELLAVAIGLTLAGQVLSFDRRGARDRVHVCTPTTWDSSSLQRPKSSFLSFHLRAHSRFATLRSDNHKWQIWHWPLSREKQRTKTGSHQVVILTTLFRSVASRARTRRHLSASESRSRQDHAHLDYRNVQQRTQGRSSSGPTSRDECRDLACHWDGAQIATHCLACRDITSGTLSRAVATTQRSSGSSNAKGICNCNRRCAFLFLAPQGRGSVHQSEGSPMISQLQSVAFREKATKGKREMDPARQRIPTAPPCGETSKHCASSCTAIVFLLVASDGHRNGRFSTQNNARPPDRKSSDFATGIPIKGSDTPRSLSATLYMQRWLALVFEMAGQQSQLQ